MKIPITKIKAPTIIMTSVRCGITFSFASNDHDSGTARPGKLANESTVIRIKREGWSELLIPEYGLGVRRASWSGHVVVRPPAKPHLMQVQRQALSLRLSSACCAQNDKDGCKGGW